MKKYKRVILLTSIIGGFCFSRVALATAYYTYQLTVPMAVLTMTDEKKQIADDEGESATPVFAQQSEVPSESLPPDNSEPVSVDSAIDRQSTYSSEVGTTIMDAEVGE